MLLTLSILAPIFGMFMLGAALARGSVLSVDNVGALLKLVTWVALPALLFRAVVNGSGRAADLRVAVVYLAACAVLLAVGMVFARLALGLKLAESTLFGMGAIYSNSSLIGVPIAQALLGHEGVQILAAIIAVHIQSQPNEAGMRRAWAPRPPSRFTRKARRRPGWVGGVRVERQTAGRVLHSPGEIAVGRASRAMPARNGSVTAIRRTAAVDTGKTATPAGSTAPDTQQDDPIEQQTPWQGWPSLGTAARGVAALSNRSVGVAAAAWLKATATACSATGVGVT